MTRLPGLRPSRCACGLRGFSTGHPCPVEKLAASMRPPFGLSSTRPPRHTGPPVRSHIKSRAPDHTGPSICRSELVRDRNAWVYRSVGWSRTSALLQGTRRPVVVNQRCCSALCGSAPRDKLPTTATTPSRPIPDARQESAATPSRSLANPVTATSSADGMPFANNGHAPPVLGGRRLNFDRD